MKVVLVSLNSKYIHSSLGVWYLKSAALKLCKSVNEIEILELTIHASAEKIAAQIDELSPEIIGFSCYIWNIEKVKECLKIFREKASPPFIILGGPEVSFNCDEVLKKTAVDAVIAGEGELAFSSLLDAVHQLRLNKNKPIRDIKGVYLSSKYRTDHLRNIVEVPLGINDSKCASYLLEPPSPYSDEYFERLNDRIIYLETSRGCPFSCAFCLSGQSKLRFFSLERAKEELTSQSRTGATTIKFVDRTFNCYKKRSDELISFIIESAREDDGFRSKCYHLEVGADLFDGATIELLNSAPKGLFQVEAGIQSYYHIALEACARKTDFDKMTENLLRLINPAKIHVHVDLIAGLPFEGFQEFQNSFNKAFMLNPHMLQLGFLKMIHGSRLRNEAEKDNPHGYVYDQRPPYEIKYNKYISERELAALEDVEYHLGQLYNSGRFVKTVEYLLGVTKFSPFKLFDSLGREMPHTHSVALDSYVERVQAIMQSFPNVDKTSLTEVLAQDYYCSVRNANLPLFLENNKDKKRKITKQVRNRKEEFGINGMFKVYLLSNDGDHFYLVDYEEYDIVLKRFKGTRFNINEKLGELI